MKLVYGHHDVLEADRFEVVRASLGSSIAVATPGPVNITAMVITGQPALSRGVALQVYAAGIYAEGIVLRWEERRSREQKASRRQAA